MNFNLFRYTPHLLIIVISTILTACGEHQEPLSVEDGLYLANNVNIVFDNDNVNSENDANETLDSVSNKVNSAIETIQSEIQHGYYKIAGNQLIITANSHESIGIITPENFVITPQSTYQLSIERSGEIKLLSKDHPLCAALLCEIQFTLIKTDPSDPRLLNLTASKALKASEAPLTETAVPMSLDISDEAIKEILEMPFWGVPHAITDHLILKLSPAQSNGLRYGMPEHTELKPFKLQDIALDPQDESLEILSFYTNEVPSNEVHQIDTYSYLFIIQIEKSLSLDLSKIRPNDHRYYTTKSGFIAEDSQGFYAINYYNFPQLKQAVIVLTEGLNHLNVIKHFRAIETLQNRTAAEMESLLITPYEISLQDSQLTLSTLENRYDITLSELFRVDEIARNYSAEISRLIKSQDLFVKTGPNTDAGYHLFKQFLGDYHFNETYIRLHPARLSATLKAIRSANAGNAAERGHKKVNDLWVSPIYTYSIQPNEASGLSYLKEIQPGVTLEIFSPSMQGHVAEKVLFGKMLQQFDFSNLPKIKQDAIPNIGKYTLLPVLNDISTEITEEIVEEMVEGEVIEKMPAEIPKTPQKVASPLTHPANERYIFQEGETDLNGHLLKE